MFFIGQDFATPDTFLKSTDIQILTQPEQLPPYQALIIDTSAVVREEIVEVSDCIWICLKRVFLDLLLCW